MNIQRARTIEVLEYVGRRVVVRGWLHARRTMGGIAFVVLRDGWGVVQIVAEAENLGPLGEAGLESVIEVEGQVVANPRAPGGVELVQPRATVLVEVHQPLPVTRGRGMATAGLARILDHGPTTLREPTRRAPLRLAAVSAAAFRQHLTESGFTEVFTPRIVGAATEGGANVFEVEYFGSAAYLAQSPQLYKQMMVGVFERVFEVGPVFRAEPHATVRHLSEYTSLDVELGFIEGPHEVAAVAVGALRAMSEAVSRQCEAELSLLQTRPPRIVAEVPTISFAEARRRLASAGVGPEQGEDLAPAEERWLGQWASESFESDVLVVHGYPASKRPFYTMPEPGNPASTHSFDILLGGTELVTGGQRIHEHATLVEAMKRGGLAAEPFGGYLDAFEFGLPPHGGFAIGLERWVTGLAGLDNIRRARAFPRDRGRTTP